MHLQFTVACCRATFLFLSLLSFFFLIWINFNCSPPSSLFLCRLLFFPVLSLGSCINQPRHVSQVVWMQGSTSAVPVYHLFCQLLSCLRLLMYTTNLVGEVKQGKPEYLTPPLSSVHCILGFCTGRRLVQFYLYIQFA